MRKRLDARSHPVPAADGLMWQTWDGRLIIDYYSFMLFRLIQFVPYSYHVTLIIVIIWNLFHFLKKIDRCGSACSFSLSL
jgi:hypothetical protein